MNIEQDMDNYFAEKTLNDWDGDDETESEDYFELDVEFTGTLDETSYNEFLEKIKAECESFQITMKEK